MTSRVPPHRGGFTLTEILVAIAIIGILASLVASFVLGTSDRRRAANTELTIQTVNKVFQHHWSQVIADAKKEDIGDPIQFSQLYLLSGKTGGLDPSGERTRVIWIKLRLMEAFPMSYGEVNDNKTPNAVYQTLATYIPTNRRKNWSTYKKYLKNTAGMSLLAAADPNTESAACLLMALSTVNRGGTILSQDSLAYAISDSDGDGIKELIDAWVQRAPPSPFPATLYSQPELPPGYGLPTAFSSPGKPGKPQPLRFYRFAWANTATNPAWPFHIQQYAPNTNSGVVQPLDPVDGKGVLLNPAWFNAKNGVTTLGVMYEQAVKCAIGTIPPTVNAPPNYNIPVIVSSGRDGYFGLQHEYINANPAQLGHLMQTMNNPEQDDNIYSYTLRNQ